MRFAKQAVKRSRGGTGIGVYENGRIVGIRSG